MFEVFLAALDFLAKAAVAVLATLVAVRLALSRFKTEALWNKKFEAYNKILESLHFARLEAAGALGLPAGRDPPKLFEYRPLSGGLVTSTGKTIADEGSVIPDDNVRFVMRKWPFWEPNETCG